jgi:hypothetical protein
MLLGLSPHRAFGAAFVSLLIIAGKVYALLCLGRTAWQGLLESVI